MLGSVVKSLVPTVVWRPIFFHAWSRNFTT